MTTAHNPILEQFLNVEHGRKVQDFLSKVAARRQQRNYIEQLFTKQAMNNTSRDSLSPLDLIDIQRRVNEATKGPAVVYPKTKFYPTRDRQLTMDDIRAVNPKTPKRKYGRI